ncbi:hypothetical protein CYMTET_7186 [Cymbomonas tetramitiformis]|uniref:Uncharacterized protein n=1 Tax=Cymbomonas tetramitiformis TaxID=36881 RepID=A0AAE0GVN4_9CHLO|nr:hypothetical protein CYMTET_7186 [Cymbomonas tetramitiformis]
MLATATDAAAVGREDGLLVGVQEGAAVGDEIKGEVNEEAVVDMEVVEGRRNAGGGEGGVVVEGSGVGVVEGLGVAVVEAMVEGGSEEVAEMEGVMVGEEPQEQ